MLGATILTALALLAWRHARGDVVVRSLAALLTVEAAFVWGNAGQYLLIHQSETWLAYVAYAALMGAMPLLGFVYLSFLDALDAPQVAFYRRPLWRRLVRIIVYGSFGAAVLYVVLMRLHPFDPYYELASVFWLWTSLPSFWIGATLVSILGLVYGVGDCAPPHGAP